MTTDREALLPCPFCGDTTPQLGEIRHGDKLLHGFIVECCDCTANIDRQDSEEAAVAAWNRRAAAPSRAQPSSLGVPASPSGSTLQPSASASIPNARHYCTCDGAGRGPGRPCVVKAGGRLGDGWACREERQATDGDGTHPNQMEPWS
jgi:Lar family restriction alleviation protein